LILWPTSDNAQFTWPVIVNRFPTPDLWPVLATL